MKIKQCFILAVILFMFCMAIFLMGDISGYEANRYVGLIIVNGLHGLLYENAVLRRINAMVSCLIMIIVQLVYGTGINILVIAIGIAIAVLVLLSFVKSKK